LEAQKLSADASAASAGIESTESFGNADKWNDFYVLLTSVVSCHDWKFRLLTEQWHLWSSEICLSLLFANNV
jgi:hypothetical protein